MSRRGLALALALSAGGAVWAQQLEPRSYSNAPIGLNFLILGYTHSSGDVLVDPSLPIRDVAARVHFGFVGYARVLNLAGQSATLSVAVPYAGLDASGSVEGQPRSIWRTGFADPAVRLSMNLLGAPALSMNEFRRWRQDSILGVSVSISAPLGRYDSQKLVNIGTNRWAIRPEVGASKALGRFTLEGALGATLYADNDEFFGDSTREQEPIWAGQAHAIYNFAPGVWAALNATYYTGGRTTIDGVDKDDLQSNWRWGGTLTLPVAGQALKLYFSTGVATRTGTDFDSAGVAWQWRWGGE